MKLNPKTTHTVIITTYINLSLKNDATNATHVPIIASYDGYVLSKHWLLHHLHMRKHKSCSPTNKHNWHVISLSIATSVL